jgi:hypothetical protein
VPKPSAFEAEMTNEKLKRHKSLGTDKSQQNSFKRGVEGFALKSTNLLILFAVTKYCLMSGTSRLLWLLK